MGVGDWLTVHHGDCRDVLPTLPERSVHCVVTSPPYWGLRDYGHTDQIGLEATPEEYVANMVNVFREVRRVLRDDGTVWLNLGDSYATGAGKVGERPGGGAQGDNWRGSMTSPNRMPLPGLKPKDLVGIPWRVAFALQADGWYLRSDIIWSKPNPMPESVTDRPTKSHEYVFLLSKSARYYFDQEAVRETATEGTDLGLLRGRQFVDGERVAWHAPSIQKRQAEGVDSRTGNPSGARNIRSVWTIATQPYPGAHFAVFPEALVEPCIKAGTSERGCCGECGAPWERVVEPAERIRAHWEGTEQVHAKAAKGKHGATSVIETGHYQTYRTTGWRPTCTHDAEPGPATVLDPFGGSGTVGRVANRLSRRAVLIELNADYIKQVEARTMQTPLGLAG